MALTQLHDGIDVPEYATRIPWLITWPELYEYIPAGAFTMSPGGWPQLRFTLLGVTAAFGFNFVAHPESRLLGVGFADPDDGAIEEAFRVTSTALRSHLGDPNEVDLSEHHHEMWRDERVWVNHSAGVPEDPAAVRRHSLDVYYHAGKPRAWVDSSDRMLTQVKRLLNLMPGVEVIEVWRKPTLARLTPVHTSLCLAIGSLPSLARLADITRAANVRFQVEVDEYRRANGELSRDDPAGILYRIGIPGPHEPELGGSLTTLQIVGIYLTRDLQEQGLLGEEEVDRLLLAFHNYDRWECDEQSS